MSASRPSIPGSAMRSRSGGWRDAVARGGPIAPTVLILGGFLSAPPYYWPMARRLRARGVADVVIGNIWTPDWLLAAPRGLGPILTRASRALLEASARSEASDRSLGAPVLLVGHSAGGMVGRLLTSPHPFAGRPLNGAGRIGALVTLGTPHVVSSVGDLGHQVALHAARFADRHVPGATFAPRVGYLAVGARSVAGHAEGSRVERRLWRTYHDLLARPGAERVEGDGLVPLESALLPGVPSLVLDEAGHGLPLGPPWYGSDAALDRWWPVALETWHGALRARVGA